MNSSSSMSQDLNLRTLSDYIECLLEQLTGVTAIIERHKRRLETLLVLVDTLRLKEKKK